MGKVEAILVVLLIILILFGSKKIPDLARSIGESVKELKNGFNGDNSSKKSETDNKEKEDSSEK
ncbi:MAG TPA: twin-arginine translocase TatA/TatE family subunit [Candidatus Saccharimonadia bacterium]|nr:twin-arginine translocase TatA/TatE family subunit [Candidatus Saccharimonadia bacterium]